MRKKKVRTIRIVITRWVVAVIIMTTLAVSVVGSMLYYENMVQHSNTIRIEGLSAIADSVDVELEQFDFCAALLTSNSKIKSQLLQSLDYDVYGKDTAAVLNYNLVREMNTVLAELTPLSQVFAVGVYFHDGSTRYFSTIMREDLYDLAAVENAVMQVRKNPAAVVKTAPFNIWGDKWLMGIVRTLPHPVNYDPFAELVVLVEPSTLSKCLPGKEDSLSANRNVYLVSESGDVIASSASLSIDNIADLLISLENCAGDFGILPMDKMDHVQILYKKIGRMPWTLIELSDNSGATRSILANAMIQPVVALICILFSMLFIVFMARMIERPLHAVIDDMQRVAGGELIEAAEGHVLREVDELSASLNHMVARLRRSLDLVYKKEIKQKEAEFYSLQAQINPHFFYNTLETINMTLLVREQYDLSELVVDLADILRFNVSNKETIIPLGDEMDLIKKYLQIMQRRFEDRLRCEIDCSPESLNCRVVKLMIQPLVENAIMHGIEGAETACAVHIRSRVDADRLIVEVQDDGVGIEPEVARQISADTYKGKHDRHSGVGIHNIVQRIRMYYGEEYGVDIRPADGGGTLVTVTLPASFDMDKEESVNENSAG